MQAPPGIFPFLLLAFWVACGSAFWALPELGLYSLRQPLFFFFEAGDEYWRVVRAASSRHNRQLAPNQRFAGFWAAC